jgi:ABC-type glycerol-3-phosphate transport system permease component
MAKERNYEMEWLHGIREQEEIPKVIIKVSTNPPAYIKRGSLVRKLIFCFIFIFLLLPMYFMFIGSFQEIKGLMIMPPRLIPWNATLSNYMRIFSLSKPIWIANTLIVTLTTLIFSVLVSCSAGYAFAFFKFPCKRILWVLLLIGIMLPRISLLIPQYVVIKELGISGTLAAVILPCVFNPVGMYLARTYFETVPMSLLESSRLDGAHEWQILRHIVMPISKPIIAALSVFAAIGSLSDFIWQMIVLQQPNRLTLLIGLMRAAMIKGGGAPGLNPIGKSLAVGCLLLIPLVIVFAIGNRYFVGSLGGAIKE